MDSMDPLKSSLIKKMFFILFFIFVVLFVLFSVARQSIIQLNFGEVGEYNITITNLDTGDSSETTHTGDSWSKRVERGNYQITVLTESSSSVDVLNTKGFFRTSESTVNLINYLGYSSVGSGVKNCQLYSNGSLSSYSCTGNTNSVVYHTPASGKSPSFTTKITPTISESSINNDSISEEKNENKSILDSINEQNRVALLLQGDNFINIAYLRNGSDGTILEDGVNLLQGLDSSQTYSFSSYREGYLVYNKFSGFRYYYSPASKNLDSLGSVSVNGQDMEIEKSISYQDRIYTIFTNRNIIDRNEDRTSVVVESGDSLSQYNYDFIYSGAEFCSAEYICGIVGEKLVLLDQDFNQKVLLTGIESFSTNKAGRVLVGMNDGSVIDMDINTEKGHLVTRKNDQILSSVSLAGDSAPLIVYEGFKSNSALLFSAEGKNKNYPQLAKSLDDSSSIGSYSLYGQTLYISPEYGRVEYIDPTIGYDFNPDFVATVNSELDTLFSENTEVFENYEIVNVVR